MEQQWVDFKAVKDAVSIEAALGHYGIQLRRVNADNLRGRCPLPTHAKQGSGDQRSFSANTAKNAWACQSSSCTAARGGRKGGNVLDFVASMEGCSVREAALKLQAWFNLAAKPAAAKEAERSELAPRETDTVPAATPAAVEAASDQGENPPEGEGNKPLSFQLKDVKHDHPYLRGRGFEPSVCEDLGAGFFPGKGLMAGRIVFPIHNAQAELVAYAGRAVDDREPRWLFPKGFRKGMELYHLHRVLRNEPRRHVVVVESFWGVLACVRAGVPNVVALMGRTLAAAQEKLLECFAEVVLALDGDEPGREATAEIGTRFLQKRRSFRVVYLPEGKQPDELSSEEELRWLLTL